MRYLKINWSKIVNWFTIARTIAIVLLVIGLAGVIPGKLGSYVDPEINKIHVNISPELIGIGITVLIIDAANERRVIELEKKDLILQMGSPDNAFAIEALRKLRARGWLKDGSLRKANLAGSNLQEANLYNAVMKGVNLSKANLSGAILVGVDLSNSSLAEAELTLARLHGANLRETFLRSADFTEAVFYETDQASSFLQEAELHGAYMVEANLTNAKVTDEQLMQANALRFASMPSGYRYNGRFNLPGDIIDYEIMRSQKAVRGVSDFYGVPDDVYQRGQDWRNIGNGPLMYDPNLEEWYRINDNPDGKDLYESEPH